MMKVGFRRAVFTAFGVMLAVLAVYICGTLYYDHRTPNFGSVSEIYVYPDMTCADVLEQIREKADVRSLRSLRRSFRSERLTDEPGHILKPGHYVISDANSSIYVARMLKCGWQSPVSLVLSGSMRRKSDIARKISRQMMLDSLTVIEALDDSAFLSGYGFSPENVFALFMPDTYQIWWTGSMKDVIDRQKAAYDAFWTEANIEKAKAQGLSQMEVSILASIVKGESNYVPEYPKIAGVYLNRLHRGWKLQADPTIAFCYGYTLNRILKKHLKVDSPYNTYINYGLPPAPVNVPGRDAMNAVLNPDGGDYLFFCASPDFNGTHLFASSYSEHLKNARAFQRALNARQKDSAGN